MEQWAAQHYNRRLANSGASAAAAAAGFGSGFNGNGYPPAAAGSPFLGINGNPAATPGATVHHPPTAGATVRNSSNPVMEELVRLLGILYLGHQVILQSIT